MPFLFDAHLDLAWCAVSYNRDLTQSVEEIRRAEQHMSDVPGRGRNVLSLPELRRAGVPVCVATLLARCGVDQKPQLTYSRTDLEHATPAIAAAAAHAQLAYYLALQEQGHVRLIGTAAELDTHWQQYVAAPDTTPLGLILSMEGADPIVAPRNLEQWHRQGLRAIGLSHYGRGRYAYGTAVEGPLSAEAPQLLSEMRRLGIALDVTHLCDTSFAQAVEIFDGPLLASHHNCRTLVPSDRQLTDEQIGLLIQRDAVIGAALDAWMLYPGWRRGETLPEVVGLDAVADHIDHICQLAGSTRHCGIGSDLDGGFGNEQTPRDLRRYTDIQRLAEILSARNYSDADVEAIFHGNWLRLFRRALPA
ncbi:MAG: dipeptidase [Planctomycetia bacterium]|nr:dipeptidase [Planctomycetia bacterium]